MNKKDYSLVILDTDLSELEIKDTLGLEDYPDKQEINELTELKLMQLLLTRKAIMEKTGYLGEQMRLGNFVSGNDIESSWKIYKLDKGSERIAIYWSHFDDDSWSLFFKGNDLELDYLYYEN